MIVPKKIEPSILLSGIFHTNIENEDNVYNIVSELLTLSFYKNIETRVPMKSENRLKLRRLIENEPIILTQWATRNITEEGLDPNALSSETLSFTIERFKELIELCVESGGQRLAFISGNDPGVDKREEAKKYFKEFLFSVGEYASQFNNFSLLLEPLDREKHKKKFIGPTSDAISYLKEIEEYKLPIYLCWDSAHVKLNNESILDSLKKSGKYIGQIHLANAVLEEKSPNFGDRHIEIGKKGFLTLTQVQEILKNTSTIEFSESVMQTVAIEAYTPKGRNAWDEERRYRQLLHKCLKTK